ncbi:hypothetical protein [Amnibacterium kyonggiense]|uniref:Signal transduction histidine kinase n=1 Tax=Amnibacterium kyonggiense TaxID=595671 RepID=A0A4R7FIX1_9MICO|nr:hypothetical protein [Amnibacterium kyonggiense]TDS74922.1 hypothetical protein CLV52_3446 [Amnibacterium kyonggiense]
MRRGTSLTPPLGTPLARLLLVAFVAVHVLLVVGPGPTSPPVTIGALAAMTAAAAIVVLSPGPGLNAPRTLAVVLLAVGSTAAIIPWLPATGWPGYASWPLGAGTFVAIGLSLRDRTAAAWVQLVLVTGLCFLWSALGGASPLSGLGLVDRHLGILLIGTLFAIGLRRTARAHDALVEVRRAETLERDMAEAELAARQEAVQRVLADAGPLLRRIADEETFDEAGRNQLAAVEGRLRDEISLAPIRSDALDQALTAARQRGLDVQVLTEPELGNLPAPTRIRAAEWLAGQLDRARGGEFVGRVVLRGRDVRVSATVDERIEDRIIGDADG